MRYATFNRNHIKKEIALLCRCNNNSLTLTIDIELLQSLFTMQNIITFNEEELP